MFSSTEAHSDDDSRDKNYVVETSRSNYEKFEKRFPKRVRNLASKSSSLLDCLSNRLVDEETNDSFQVR